MADYFTIKKFFGKKQQNNILDITFDNFKVTVRQMDASFLRE